MKLFPCALAAALLLVNTAAAADPSTAISTDAPADVGSKASLQIVHIPSHGVAINGMIYRAAGAAAHPTVVLLHGLPGFEENLDLAQAMRRAGWNVLSFHYRGSWGSPGEFSFDHEFEDVQAALDFLRAPANASKYGVDPKRLVLMGHSVGGLAAAVVGAKNAELAGVAMISAADLGGFAYQGEPAVRAYMSQSVETLVGTTPLAMAQEIMANQKAWEFVNLAPQLSRRPLLLVTSDDGMADPSEALGKAVTSAGGAVTQAHLATDHVYSDKRIALQIAVLGWLDTLQTGVR